MMMHYDDTAIATVADRTNLKTCDAVAVDQMNVTKKHDVAADSRKHDAVIAAAAGPKNLRSGYTAVASALDSAAKGYCYTCGPFP